MRGRKKVLKRLSFMTSILMFFTLLMNNVTVNAEQLVDKVIIDVTDFGADPSGKRDSAEAIYEAIESAKKYDKPVIINFPKGEYQIYKDKAQKREYHTSNTNSIENPIKSIGILIEEQKDLTLEGNGSLFNMHGNMMALAVAKSENVVLNNFSWDFEVPTTTEMTVVDIGTENGKNYVDYYIPPNFRYQIVDNDTSILWTSEESPYTGEYYWTAKGHHNSWSVVINTPEIGISRRHNLNESPFNRVNNIREIEPNKVRFIYNGEVPAGQKLGAVNEMLSNAVRETAGAFIWESKDTVIKNVNVHYMHGFGWLTQMSENVTYDTVNFMPREGTGKYTTSFADLIHVSGAKGKIKIVNSNFSHAHDDPINIHGTFTRVEEKIDNKTLRLKYIHGQQGGFPQYHVGDEVTFFTRDTLMSPGEEEILYKVIEVSQPGEDGNDLRNMIVKFDKELPVDIDSKIGNEPKYVAENVTYTPEIEILNNNFHTIPTRGILATTRKKVLIEGNTFENMAMASIFLSNDSDVWYESGPIRDLTIRNNKFYIREAIGQNEWAFKPAIYIHPVTKGGNLPSAETPIHKNITIEGNEFYMEHDTAVKAESVENLIIRNNKIIRDNPNVTLNLSLQNTELNVNEKAILDLQSSGTQISGNEENAYYFQACKNVIIEGNTYDDGLIKNAVVQDMPLDYITNHDEITLNGSTEPSAPVSEVKYTSLNPEVATVSNYGEITAVATGEAEILAYYIWNGTSIESNKIKVTVIDEEKVEKPDSVTITNLDNIEVNRLNDTVQFTATTEPSTFQGAVAWAVANVDGTSTSKATIDNTGLLTAKENGVILVKAEVNGIVDVKTLVIADTTISQQAPYVNIINHNPKKIAFDSIGEMATITMEKGDLYNSDNTAKNVLLVDIPKNIDKNDVRISVKAENLPIRQSNRWDTGSILLYNDMNNYISIGRKSHFDGVVSVREVNGQAVEANKGSTITDTTLIFDIYKKDNTVTISYKTPTGEFVQWGTLDAEFLGDTFKVGFAVWNHDGTAKDVKFSNLKIADGSEYTKETILNVPSIKFISNENNRPIVSDVVLNKETANLGDEIEVSYTYVDSDNDVEGRSIYRWDTTKDGKVTTEFTTTNSYVINKSGDLTCTVYPLDSKNLVGQPVKSEITKVSSSEDSALLSEIVINGTLLKGFEGNKVEYNYDLTKSQNTMALNVKAINNNDNIQIKVGEEVIVSSTGSASKEFEVTENSKVTIIVKSSITDSQKVYIIDINKYVDNYADLDSISVDEIEFNASGNLNKFYHRQVAGEIETITIKATASDRVGDIKVYQGEYRKLLEDVDTTSNGVEAVATLESGNNIFLIEAIAKDGVTKKVHKINIARNAYNDSTLSDIKINGNTIEGFASEKLDYTIRVSREEATTFNFEAIANNSRSNTSITANNKRVDSSIATLDLVPGKNEVVIACKADDSWTTSYYTITIIVESDKNAQLLSLETPNNNLDPLFDSRKTDYKIITSRQEFQLRAEAQEIEATIEVSVNGKKKIGTNVIEINEKLVCGNNEVIVKVISPDKSESKVYKIEVTANEFVYLSDLNWEAISTPGYGGFQRDKAPNGAQIRLLNNGEVTTFNKGLGAHAPSELVFNIDGKGYERFQGYAGVDYSQATSQYGQVTFKVLLDGVEAFNSGETHGSKESKYIDLDLTGVKQIKLVAVSGANDWNDHAVWADAKFTTTFDEVEPPTPVVDADLNKDGVIDLKDLALASKWYGENKPEYDINDDGIIDEFELDIITAEILK